jgi:hypothetical protein
VDPARRREPSHYDFVTCHTSLAPLHTRRHVAKHSVQVEKSLVGAGLTGVFAGNSDVGGTKLVLELRCATR